jgi:hypothetical protein
MFRLFAPALLSATLALSAHGQAPDAPSQAAAAQSFTIGDANRVFDSATVRGQVLAIHFVPEIGEAQTKSAIAEYTAGGPTLAGVRQIVVSAEKADAFRSALAGLPANSIPAYRDGDGELAKRFGVASSTVAIVVLDPDGREIYRNATTSSSDHLSFPTFAAKIGELTKDKGTAQANLGPSHLALQGYDPTAYLDERKAVLGDKKIESAFRGITYRFASTSARDKFNADPVKYIPAYGGWCATAMAKNDKVEIDPKNFKVSGGRVFLFYKGLFGNALDDWNKDEPGLTTKADTAWRKLTTTP